MKKIYLDYNATTPLHEEVIEAMRPYLGKYFGNPSSSHWFGAQTKKAIENARKQLAELINCNPDEIIFTSGGTESNNYAIKGFVFANKSKGNHIITSGVEHPAVTEVCKYLEKQGFNVTYLPVDETGLVNVNDVEEAITTQTILISIMHANNEVGTIQPISGITSIARKHQIAVHTDAAQSIGKILVDVEELNVDLLSVAGHKFYAPKGIGALYIRRGTQLEKQIHGADHEQNLRAGTENVLEIVGIGKAAEITKRDLEKSHLHLKSMRDRLLMKLSERIKNLKINGHADLCLPNTLNISFKNIDANTLLSELSNIGASAGAACHSDKTEISSVLTAMNVSYGEALGAVRFSTGRYTTSQEIDEAANQIVQAYKHILQTEEKGNQTQHESEKIKLTQYTHGMGCACKIKPQVLEKIIRDNPFPDDPNVLVGMNTADDAAVYKLDEETAIVKTIDFFTPMVDDPYYFGAIGAANALSDIYAMGAEPLFALNIVGFPVNRLPLEVLDNILKGANDKASEAGINILGGHSIDDNEPKYGMVVTGKVHPEKILTNANAQPGDVILLTKPIGTGIISTAIKKGIANDNTVDTVVKIMSTLNKTAAQIMKSYPVHSCTDVTGFGLLGHLLEITRYSKVNAEIYIDKIPVIPGTYNFASANIIPGGTLNNLDFVTKSTKWGQNIAKIQKIVLSDAQTSGGLLIFIPDKFAKQLIHDLHKQGISEASTIGVITGKGMGTINVY
jgi:cysteine desulfurase